jgi:hypothetical protein
MCGNNEENEEALERLLKLLDEIDYLKDDLETWSDALEELSEIREAFETNGSYDLSQKTILDVGTDAVKPLYIALKFKPRKIVGISDGFRPFVSDIELKSRILNPTKIRFYTCSLFNKETLNVIRDNERITEFNFVLVSKTLHHLRTGECIANKRDENHNCPQNETERETEENCIYEFETRKIFDRLLELGHRVIIYEWFDPNENDNDKIRGRGAHFTREEWGDVFMHLSNDYRVQFIRPEKFPFTKGKIKKVEAILRKVDEICFYVEKKNNRAVSCF